MGFHSETRNRDRADFSRTARIRTHLRRHVTAAVEPEAFPAQSYVLAFEHGGNRATLAERPAFFEPNIQAVEGWVTEVVIRSAWHVAVRLRVGRPREENES